LVAVSQSGWPPADPCFLFHRLLIRAADLEPVPVPVDEQGIRTSLLAGLDVGAVLRRSLRQALVPRSNGEELICHDEVRDRSGRRHSPRAAVK
jgi:hypothetical protein